MKNFQSISQMSAQEEPTDGKDVKSSSGANKSIQKNLDSQSSSKVAGSGRLAGLGRFESNDYGGTSFVDASTACNEVNDDVNGYFRSILFEALSIYDVRE